MNEDDLLSIVAEYFPGKGQGVELGRGDDCAVLAAGHNLAVSTDIFCEDSHFRREYFSPEDLGHKCLAVNLSDLAAAGASPLGFTLGLTLTGKEDEDWMQSFCRGMAALARQHHVVLMGGDLARGKQLNMCPTVWGRVQGRGLLRAQARAEDVLFCVGELGLARGGLFPLEQAMAEQGGYEKIREDFPLSVSQHLRPEPRCREGLILAGLGRHCHLSLMDVSDGAARDLPRLLGQNEGDKLRFGAELTLKLTDLNEETLRIAQLLNCDPLQFALAGGEDYALMGTCPQEAWPELQRALPQAWQLGQVTEKTGLWLNGEPLKAAGFDHFA